MARSRLTWTIGSSTTVARTNAMLSLAPQRSRPAGHIRNVSKPANTAVKAPRHLIRTPEVRQLHSGQSHWLTTNAGVSSPLLRGAW